MKKMNNLLGTASVLLILLATGNRYVLLKIQKMLPTTQAPQWMAGMVAVFILLMAALTALALLLLFLQFRHFRQASLLRAFTFVLGFFCLFLLVVDTVMLQDIGQEFKAGFDSIGEWRMVYFSHMLQGGFAILLLLQVFQARKQIDSQQALPLIEKNEVVFLTVHQVGIFSALLGFFCMAALKLMGAPQGYLDGLFVIASIVAMMPYGLAVIYWLFMKRKEKPVDWYDEKQLMDLSRGALITLVISVLLMSVVFVLTALNIMQISTLKVFSLYLCGTLLVFSLSNQLIAD